MLYHEEAGDFTAFLLVDCEIPLVSLAESSPVLSYGVLALDPIHSDVQIKNYVNMRVLVHIYIYTHAYTPPPFT